MDTYIVNRDGSGLRKLSDDEAKALPPPERRYLEGQAVHGLFARRRHLHLRHSDGKIRQVTKTTESETNPHFLPDGKHISFTRAGNLYVMSLETGFLEQMTDIRAAAPRRRCRCQPAGPAAAEAEVRWRRRSRRWRGAAAGRGGRAQATAAPAQEYLKKEQKELFDTVREHAALRAAERPSARPSL